MDNQESYSTNEITIYWNSPLTYLLAFTESNMTERVKGDVNADGTFDLADVVSMQRWLLTESDGTLVDWETGDLYQDGILNVLDLCRMKQQLLS